MLLVVAIQLIKEEAVAEILDKLPEDLRLTFMQYSELFRNEGIIPLLESSQADFTIRFEQAAKHLLEYMVQIGSIIDSKYKDDPDILNNLLQFDLIGLSAIEKELSAASNEKLEISLTNAIEVIKDYLVLGADPNTQNEIVKPEYAQAFSAIITMIVSICALTMAITSNTSSYMQKTDLFAQALNHYSRELEDYVETIEIETDPEQKARLERIKTERT